MTSLGLRYGGQLRGYHKRMSISIPHLAFPLRFANGKFVVVEQDSSTEIESCMETVLLTVKGERIERPKFGIKDITFQQNSDTLFTELQDSIDEHEPRAQYDTEVDVESLASNSPAVQLRMKENNG